MQTKQLISLLVLIPFILTSCIGNQGGNRQSKSNSNVNVSNLHNDDLAKITKQELKNKIKGGDVLASMDIDENTSLALTPLGSVQLCTFVGEDAGCKTIQKLNIKYDKEHPSKNRDYISDLDDRGIFHVMTGVTPNELAEGGARYTLMGVNSVISAFRCNYKDFQNGKPLCTTTPIKDGDYSGTQIVRSQVYNYNDSEKINSNVDKILDNYVRNVRKIDPSLIRDSILRDTPSSLDILKTFLITIDAVSSVVLLFDIVEFGMKSAITDIEEIAVNVEEKSVMKEYTVKQFREKINDNYRLDLYNKIDKYANKIGSMELKTINNELDTVLTHMSTNVRFSKDEFNVLKSTLEKIKIEISKVNPLDKEMYKEVDELYIEACQNYIDYYTVMVGEGVPKEILEKLQKKMFDTELSSFDSNIIDSVALKIERNNNAINIPTANCKDKCSYSFFGTESKKWDKNTLGSNIKHTGGIWKSMVKIIDPDLTPTDPYFTSYYQLTDMDCTQFHEKYPNAVYAAQLETDHWDFIVDIKGNICNLDKIKDLNSMIHQY